MNTNDAIAAAVPVPAAADDDDDDDDVETNVGSNNDNAVLNVEEDNEDDDNADNANDEPLLHRMSAHSRKWVLRSRIFLVMIAKKSKEKETKFDVEIRCATFFCKWIENKYKMMPVLSG